MTTKEKYDLLKVSPLFKRCDEETLNLIAQDTYYKAYKKGEQFLSGESTFHKISIIVNNGRMKIFTLNPKSTEEFTLYIIGKGDIFNVITFLDNKKDELCAIALDDLEILHCNIDLARDWIKKFECFNTELLIYLTERLRMAQEYNISKTFYSIEVRLAKLIIQNITSDNSEFNLINNLSHTEIANILGTTRTVVNRNLQELKKDGLIDVKYKKLIIKDYESLKNVADQ